MCSLPLKLHHRHHRRYRDLFCQSHHPPMIQVNGQHHHRLHRCLIRAPDSILRNPSSPCRISISRFFTPKSSRWHLEAMVTKRNTNSGWLNSVNTGSKEPVARSSSSMVFWVMYVTRLENHLTLGVKPIVSPTTGSDTSRFWRSPTTNQGHGTTIMGTGMNLQMTSLTIMNRTIRTKMPCPRQPNRGPRHPCTGSDPSAGRNSP